MNFKNFINSILILILFSNYCLCDTKDKKNLQDTLYSPNPDGPTKIYVSMLINNISEINSATQIMKADVFFVAAWIDSSLARGGGRRVLKPEEVHWDPMITISNRLSLSKTFPDEFTVQGDGTVVYIQRFYGEFTQNFDLKDFPMDTQNFYIKLISIGFAARDIQFMPDPDFTYAISDKMNLHDWKILDWKIDTNRYSIIEGEASVPAFTLSFSAKRESGFYILIYVIPLVLIIMMSWSAFWLDPKMSSSQISIATTSMLTLIAYRFIVIGNLPKISYMTRMDIFVLGSSLLIFMTLFEAILTSRFVQQENEMLASKMDKFCRWMFPFLYVVVYLIAFVF